MSTVLDASFFFGEFPAEGALFTVPAVVDELKDIRAKGNFEKWCARGLRVQSPTEESRKRVISAAETTKDVPVISATDISLLALARDLGADLLTDDFAIQNVALVLGVKTVPILHEPRNVLQGEATRPKGASDQAEVTFCDVLGHFDRPPKADQRQQRCP